MSKPTQTIALMSAQAFDTSIALMSAQTFDALADQTGAPKWVHLLPAAGETGIETGDSRGPYSLQSVEQVIAASFDGTERLPIDENHSTDLAAPLGQPSPARGWIVEMQAREDGIWGLVEWTDAGEELVSGHAYRGISPVIVHSEDDQILRILRASLVNKPNLRGLTALHSEELETEMDWIKFLAGLLGLADDATEDQVKAAAKKRLSGKKDAPDDKAATALQSQLGEIGVALGVDQSGDAAAILAAAKAATESGTAKPAEITALQSEITTLTTQVNTLTQGTAKTAATTFIDGEITKGRAGVKPLRDHYITRHMEDAASVEKEIGALPCLIGNSTILNPPETQDGKIALNAEQREVARRLGLEPKDIIATMENERANEEAL